MSGTWKKHYFNNIIEVYIVADYNETELFIMTASSELTGGDLMARITILVENSSSNNQLRGEHGLSLWIEGDGGTVLFDTGQTSLFAGNALKLGISLGDADAAVLSHGHYDHTGGMEAFLEVNDKAGIYLHPEAFITRYNGNEGIPTGDSIGIRWSEDLKGLFLPRSILNNEPWMILPGIWISGEVPRLTDIFNHGFVTEDGLGNWKSDRVVDEQFLIIQEDGEISIIAGCSHFGLKAMLAHAEALFPGMPIRGIAGGLHLKHATEKEMGEVIKTLAQLSLKWLVPLHCTGENAAYALKQVFHERCMLLGTGDSWNTMEQSN